MKRIILSILLTLPVLLSAQYQYDIWSSKINLEDKDCVEVYVSGDPAPCEWTANTDMVEIWKVQVGVYKRLIKAPRGITVQYMGGYYFYYMRDDYTEEAARLAAAFVRDSGDYCDAVAVRDPTARYLFVNKNDVR